MKINNWNIHTKGGAESPINLIVKIISLRLVNVYLPEIRTHLSTKVEG